MALPAAENSRTAQQLRSTRLSCPNASSRCVGCVAITAAAAAAARTRPDTAPLLLLLLLALQICLALGQDLFGPAGPSVELQTGLQELLGWLLVASHLSAHAELPQQVRGADTCIAGDAALTTSSTHQLGLQLPLCKCVLMLANLLVLAGRCKSCAAAAAVLAALCAGGACAGSTAVGPSNTQQPQ